MTTADRVILIKLCPGGRVSHSLGLPDGILRAFRGTVQGCGHVCTLSFCSLCHSLRASWSPTHLTGGWWSDASGLPFRWGRAGILCRSSGSSVAPESHGEGTSCYQLEKPAPSGMWDKRGAVFDIHGNVNRMLISKREPIAGGRKKSIWK